MDLPATRPLLPQWDFAAGGASRPPISSFSELRWSWTGHRNIGRAVPGPGYLPRAVGALGATRVAPDRRKVADFIFVLRKVALKKTKLYESSVSS